MTVISSVYKDDDVKCHTRPVAASAQAPPPSTFLVVIIITPPGHTVLFCLLSFCFRRSLHQLLFLFLQFFYRSPPPFFYYSFVWVFFCQTPHACWDAFCCGFANRRITIYLYLYRSREKNNNPQNMMFPEPEKMGSRHVTVEINSQFPFTRL